MAKDNFVPKNRLPVTLSGTVTSDVFPGKFQKRVGDDFVEDGDAFVYNVELPQDGAPPVTLQIQTKEQPKKGDRIDFPIVLELLLRSKYSVRGTCVIRGPGKGVSHQGNAT